MSESATELFERLFENAQFGDNAATQSLAFEGVIVSLSGRQMASSDPARSYFVVKFITQKGRGFGPLVLTDAAARALRALLEKHGF
jgi:hypothetical protein